MGRKTDINLQVFAAKDVADTARSRYSPDWEITAEEKGGEFWLRRYIYRRAYASISRFLCVDGRWREAHACIFPERIDPQEARSRRQIQEHLAALRRQRQGPPAPDPGDAFSP